MAREESDEETLVACEADAAALEKRVEDMEFRRMFSNPADPNNCFIDIQAGAGGTEACDWAAMLLRQYLRYCERKGFKTEVLEESEGDVAGIKSATDQGRRRIRLRLSAHRNRRAPARAQVAVRFVGRAAYVVFVGVRVPGNRRFDRNRDQSGRYPHGYVSRVRRGRPAHQQDRFRGASHARADRHRRAVPERPLAAPQPRGSHADAESALYEFEMRKRQAEQDKLESSKTDVGWGHQIRSYVLDNSRIKDLRTNVEISNTKAVLDGDLDDFISASLKQGV